jgi:hypothetical protein
MSIPSIAALTLTISVSVALPAFATAEDTKLNTARGRITDVQPAAGQFTLKTKGVAELKLHVDDASNLRLDNRAAKLTQFEEGSRVRVTYETRTGKNRVTSMTRIPISAQDVTRDVKEALRSAKDYAFQQKDEYAKKLESLLHDLDAGFDALRQQAADAWAELRMVLALELQTLGEKG